MATEVLGREHDRRLAQATKWALRKIGARRLHHRWSLFGSQEVVEQRWQTSAGLLVLSTETYMGLKLEGPDEVVGQVRSLVAERLR
jgi:hypothetical protein